LAAVLILLFFPTVCMASTPPVQPSLLFERSHPSTGQNLTFSVTWNGYVSYNEPPEQIIVEVFSAPDGSRLGSFPIPKTEDSHPSENTCIYRTNIKSDAFPQGTFMLIAADPLSGAINRQMISIPLHGNGNIDFFKQFDYEQMFFFTSVMIGAFLVFVIMILVREKT